MLAIVAIERVKELATDPDNYQVQVGELGKFSVVKYRMYTYSSNIQKLEMNLKEQKKGEEADGTAKAESKDILKFNVKKDEKRT